MSMQLGAAALGPKLTIRANRAGFVTISISFGQSCSVEETQVAGGQNVRFAHISSLAKARAARELAHRALLFLGCNFDRVARQLEKEQNTSTILRTRRGQG